MSMVLTDWRDSVLRWVFWAVIGGVLLVLIRGPAEVIRIGSVGILVLSLPMVGRLQYAAQAPFSFCLPGFRESLRRRCFGRAAVVGLGGALLALNLGPPAHKMAEDGDLIRACLQAAGGFLGGITVALIVGTSRLILARLDRGIKVLLLFCLLVIAPTFLMLFTVFQASFSIVAIPACTMLCVFVWLRLGDMACLKRGHRMLIEGATKRGRETATESATHWWAHFADAVTVPPWAEGLFRGWMQSRPYLSAGRYIWGALYGAFGPWFSYWESILFGLAAAALVLGLFGNEIAPGIALLYFVFAHRVIRLPVTSTVLLPGGRREKCYATLAAALAASLLLLGAAVAVVVLARVGVLLVSAAFPEGGDGLAHRATGLAGIFLPFVLVPTTLGIQLTREEGGWITWTAFTLSIATLFLILWWPHAWPDWLALALLAVLFVFGWVFFLFALDAACRRGDMGQPRLA